MQQMHDNHWQIRIRQTCIRHIVVHLRGSNTAQSLNSTTDVTGPYPRHHSVTAHPHASLTHVEYDVVYSSSLSTGQRDVAFLTHADSQLKCMAVSFVESSTQFKQCKGFYTQVSNKYFSINLIMRKFSMNQYNINKTNCSV